MGQPLSLHPAPMLLIKATLPSRVSECSQFVHTPYPDKTGLIAVNHLTLYIWVVDLTSAVIRKLGQCAAVGS